VRVSWQDPGGIRRDRLRRMKVKFASRLGLVHVSWQDPGGIRRDRLRRMDVKVASRLGRVHVSWQTLAGFDGIVFDAWT
jgi:hypothetical protein